jgi:hypothetical protein
MLQNFIMLYKDIILKRKLWWGFSHIIKLLGVNVQSLQFFLNFMGIIGVSNRGIWNLTVGTESWAILIYFSNLCL